LTHTGKKKLAPGERIRALVVDDSVIIRRLVTHALEEDPSVEVVGSAANGAIALKMIPLLRPNVVTLDIEMPEMDGLETLRNIRKSYPDLIVIMFSTLSERGAAITLEALTLGANDYVTKVANSGSLDQSMVRLRGELLPKFKQFFSFPSETPAVSAPKIPNGQAHLVAARNGAFRPKVPCDVVAVGVSTGGPPALAILVPMLPPNFRQPILITQHMPPVFTRLLADRLQSLTKLGVREATHGMLVEDGNIYVAPGDYHMRVARKGTNIILTLDQAEQENSCRPAVDVMFRSIAEIYGASAMAVILTGMGRDGLRGIEQMRALGSYVVAQDEASSVVWGMPGAVVGAGLADSIVDLRCIVPEIQRHL
jgi:two-component system, chemotaxis family, protein-glutamate methylesterase/glutaminase